MIISVALDEDARAHADVNTMPDDGRSWLSFEIGPVTVTLGGFGDACIDTARELAGALHRAADKLEGMRPEGTIDVGGAIERREREAEAVILGTGATSIADAEIHF